MRFKEKTIVFKDDVVSLFGSLKTLMNIFPVDYVPYSFNVVRSDVFVLKIVCMFPDINAEQWDKT